MSVVRITKSIEIVDALQDSRLSPLQINVLLAVYKSRTKGLEVIELVGTVRRANAENYRFVEDRYFYKAIAGLVRYGMVVYG